MEKKISQLTAKGANLASTDLLEISEVTADGYVSKHVTGSEVIASAQIGMQTELISGTNIKTLEGQSLLGSGNIDLTKSDVGLSNVDNTSDANKPISTATQTALNGKQATLVSGTNIKTVNGSSLVGSGDLTVSGGITLVAKKTQITNVGLATNVMIASEDISAHVSSASMLQITAFFKKTAGGSSATYLRLYVNNSATLTGATLIASFLRVTTAGTQTDNILNLYNDGTNFVVPATGTELTTRYNAYTGSVIAIPSPCFLVWGAQVPNGDTAIMYNSNVVKYA